MPLFTSTSELQPYADVLEGFDFTPFLGALNTADRMYIYPAVSRVFYIHLKDRATANTLTAKEKIVYELVREAEAKLAFWKWIPKGMVKISSSGIHIVTSENSKAAFQWMTDELARSWIEEGFSALEEALAFMANNLTDFPTYKNSDEYQLNHSGFVNTATEMAEHFTVAMPRVTFLQTSAIRRRLERDLIRPVLGEALATEIVTQIKAGNLSAGNKAIIHFIRGAVVNHTFNRAMLELSVTIDDRGISVFRNKESETTNVRIPADDNRLRQLQKETELAGDGYIAKLRKHLNTNSSQYPLYTKTETPRELENKQDSGIYHAL